MGKKKRPPPPDEIHLLLPRHKEIAGIEPPPPIVDTHTHLVSTFGEYKSKYPAGKYGTIFEFVKGVYANQRVESIVDVWCEAPILKEWKELADSALDTKSIESNWDGIQYHFVMGMDFLDD